MLTTLAVSSVVAIVLNHKDLPRAGFKLGRFCKRMDERYQKFVRAEVDNRMSSRARASQVEEMDGGVDPAEARVNRQVALSVGSTGVAIAGSALASPALLVLSGGAVFATMAPNVWRHLKMSLRERRLKYRFVAPLSMLSALGGGYFVALNVMSVVYLISLKTIQRTEANAQEAMRRTFSLQEPPKVWRFRDGVETEIAFDQLEIDDVVVIDAGQPIAVDGVVVDGEGSVDQRVLTGESRPAEKSPGDQVFAGTVTLSGRLFVRVERRGKDTSAAQITEILARAGQSKLASSARGERLVDNMTLPLLVTSGLALQTVGFGGAVVVFNNGYGTTSTMAGPLCMLNFLNLASEQGILIKDGRSLESLHGIDTVVFDKTGTLTLDEPVVGRVHAAAGWSEREVLAAAAMAEHRQVHPIAKAILNSAFEQGIDLRVPDDAEYEVGRGVRVHAQGLKIHVGSASFVRSQAIELPKAALAWQSESGACGASLVFVAINGEVAGAVRLEARTRPGSAKLVGRLRSRGLKTFILSGDNRQPTEHLADALAVDGWFAEVMPNDKAEIVAKLQSEGRKVCFVGDGINDALALRQADVSISLRGATTLARDSAQIVLVSPTLEPIDALFGLAGKYRERLQRSMLYGYVPGTLVIGGVFLFGLGMTAAVPFYAVGVGASMASALAPLKRLREDPAGEGAAGRPTSSG